MEFKINNGNTTGSLNFTSGSVSGTITTNPSLSDWSETGYVGYYDQNYYYPNYWCPNYYLPVQYINVAPEIKTIVLEGKILFYYTENELVYYAIYEKESKKTKLEFKVTDDIIELLNELGVIK